jgi:hypothetical protein
MSYTCAVRGFRLQHRSVGACTALAALTVLTALTVVQAAEAHPRARLRFITTPAAGECPSAEAVRAAVVAHLGYDPFTSTSDAAETIVATVDRASSGELRGSIDRYDAKGARRGHQDLAASRGECGQMASTIALSVSVAIDPIGGAPAPPASAAPLAPTLSTTSPQPPPSMIAVPPAPREQPALPTPPSSGAPVVLDVKAGPVFSVGALPQPGLGIMVGAGIRRGYLRLDLEGRMDSTLSSIPAAIGSGRVSATLTLGTVAPCIVAGGLYGCVLGSVGALQGAGTAFDRSHQDISVYVAVGARAGFEVSLPWKLSLRLQADGLAPLRPTTLEANGIALWTTPVANFAGGLAIARSFP